MCSTSRTRTSWSRETSNSITFTTNAGKQRNRGVEASVGYAFVRDSMRAVSLVRPWLSYAFTDAKFIDFNSDNNNGPGTVSFSGNAVPRVPRNTLCRGTRCRQRSRDSR